MEKTIIKLLLAGFLLCSTFGCACMSATQQRVLSGSAIGAAAGVGAAAIVGAPLAVGAAAGAAAGAVGGLVVDEMHRR